MVASRKPLKFWSLTLSHNYTDEVPHGRVQSIFEEFTSQWCFQAEAGAEAQKLHYQCRMIMPEAQMTETMIHLFEMRGYDRQDVTFIPESNNSIAQGGLSFYVMKDDTRVAGPWHDPEYKPNKRKRYEGNDLACMNEPFPFQAKIIEMIKETPNDRDIIWWYNQAGCAGKSKLMKYLRFTSDEVARVPMGSATQIKTAVIEKGPHRTYMVDLPRVRGADERQQELFSALEEIKNGWVESPMYGKNAELLMEPPHVHIFSNELPNLSHCSLDRWKVYIIEDGPFGQIFRLLTMAEVYARIAPPKP